MAIKLDMEHASYMVRWDISLKRAEFQASIRAMRE